MQCCPNLTPMDRTATVHVGPIVGGVKDFWYGSCSDISSTPNSPHPEVWNKNAPESEMFSASCPVRKCNGKVYANLTDSHKHTESVNTVCDRWLHFGNKFTGIFIDSLFSSFPSSYRSKPLLFRPIMELHPEDTLQMGKYSLWVGRSGS